ncbi:MAG: IclR family transcriptional regulator [Betaproteobacteria bacterium]|jgi:DNA-binding IclR family transcriptional regulator|nr:IclR family transcriptional regulator [Betaproteobacteria bacterium]
MQADLSALPASETNRPRAVSKLELSGKDAAGADARALRPLLLLETLSQQHSGISLSALAERLGLPKASVMRLLHALQGQAYVMRDPGTSVFTLGPRAAALGLRTLHAASVAHRYRPLLSALVQRLGETCNLTTREGAQVLYIDRVETTEPLRMTLPPGSRVPLHCTASGKLFLSQMPAPDCQALVEGLARERKTAHTHTSVAALMAEIERTRKRGIGVDNEEFINGMVAIAIPVRDAQGQCVAAVACHTPTARLSLTDLLAHAPAIERTAQQIAALLLGNARQGA